MATTEGTAEILDMEDERAKRRAPEHALGDFETAGAYLKSMREAAGLDLDEVVEKTHIRRTHLAAIEENNSAALPARAYAIGFVRAYARFLGADPNAVIARFKEDAGYVAPAAVEAEKFDPASRRAESDNRDLSLWAVAAVVAFIIWCAFQLTRPQEASPGDAADATPSATTMTSTAIEVVEASIIKRIEPVYPHRCETGAKDVETVDVAFNITSDGRVAGERVVRSSNACFERAALNAVRRWEFAPRTVDGAARPAYDQRYRFRFDRPL